MARGDLKTFDYYPYNAGLKLYNNSTDSFKDFLVVEEELAKIFAIKSKAFHSFDRSQIEYKTQLFQTTQSLLKELRGSSKLLFKELNQKEQTLYLEYLN